MLEWLVIIALYLVVGIGQVRNQTRLLHFREAYFSILEDPENVSEVKQPEISTSGRVVMILTWLPYIGILGIVTLIEFVRRDKILPTSL